MQTSTVQLQNQIGVGTQKQAEYHGPVLSFRRPGDSATLGVWWWSLKGICGSAHGVHTDVLLDMLYQNNVSEIYLELGGMEKDAPAVWQQGEPIGFLQVREFVKKCSKLDIEVVALTGAARCEVIEWIDPQRGYPEMIRFVSNIADYNRLAGDSERIGGIHLDVEPHTVADWEEKRPRYLQQMADFTIAASKLCCENGLNLAYDLFGGLRETDMVTVCGEILNILDVMTKYCQTIGVMSYSNSAEGQFAFGARRYLNYAKKNNCRLVVGCETMSPDEAAGIPPSITYSTKDVPFFIKEQQKLRQMLEETNYPNFGAAVHHIYTFYHFMTGTKEKKSK